MSDVPIAIVGAGPYGMSVAAHLAAHGLKHRIFGLPMQFWSKIAAAGNARYLKSFCFGTNVSTPAAGFSFADYSKPRGLETFEPCSIAQFAEYGTWFHGNVVPWVEPHDVVHVRKEGAGFAMTLSNGERCVTTHLVIATGLAYFAQVPARLRGLPGNLVTHTSQVEAFSSFKGRTVAVVGAGQSALEAAALLHEAGALPTLLVRDNSISWHTRSSQDPSIWERIRSPISGLGTGPKAWALTRYPGALHRVPEAWRVRFVKSHLPAEGAWWLRPRVEGIVPTELGITVADAWEETGGLVLKLQALGGVGRKMKVDHLIAGTGYTVDVDRLDFIDERLRASIQRVEGAPRLNSRFESSVPGLRFVGASSAISFGPLFRFVVGAEYTARVISTDMASRIKFAA